jgi:hypothetical protein
MEVRIFRNAALLMSRAAGAEALAWAEEERQRTLAAGWTGVNVNA